MLHTLPYSLVCHWTPLSHNTDTPLVLSYLQRHRAPPPLAVSLPTPLAASMHGTGEVSVGYAGATTPTLPDPPVLQPAPGPKHPPMTVQRALRHHLQATAIAHKPYSLSSSLLYIILSRLTKSARICLHPSYLHLILSFTHLPLLSSLFSLSIVHTHPNDPLLLCPLLLSAPIPR